MSNTLKRFTSHYNGYAFAIRAVGTLNYHGLVLLPWSSTRVVSVRHASSYTHTHKQRLPIRRCFAAPACGDCREASQYCKSSLLCRILRRVVSPRTSVSTPLLPSLSNVRQHFGAIGQPKRCSSDGTRFPDEVCAMSISLGICTLFKLSAYR